MQLTLLAKALSTDGSVLSHEIPTEIVVRAPLLDISPDVWVTRVDECTGDELKAQVHLMTQILDSDSAFRVLASNLIGNPVLRSARYSAKTAKLLAGVVFLAPQAYGLSIVKQLRLTSASVQR